MLTFWIKNNVIINALSLFPRLIVYANIKYTYFSVDYIMKWVFSVKNVLIYYPTIKFWLLSLWLTEHIHDFAILFNASQLNLSLPAYITMIFFRVHCWGFTKWEVIEVIFKWEFSAYWLTWTTTATVLIFSQSP